jgi:hypothetical protein
MIPLEKQVCSLDLAKRLKELGVKQESLFYWCKENKENPRFFIAEGYQEEDLRICSAFTVAELGEMLPYNLDDRLLKLAKCIDGSWFVYYEAIINMGLPNPRYINARRIYDQEAQTLADACAKMLIYLFEQKFVTL